MEQIREFGHQANVSEWSGAVAPNHQLIVSHPQSSAGKLNCCRTSGFATCFLLPET